MKIVFLNISLPTFELNRYYFIPLILIGVLIGLNLPPYTILILIGIWLLILVLSGYVGLGTILTGLSFPIYLYISPDAISNELMGFGIACSLLILFTHRSNIVRMSQGNENQFEKIMIFKRRT